jgi:hypothetical protein
MGMSLSDKLAKEQSKAAALTCKLAALLQSSELTAKEKQQIQQILDVPKNDPSRVSHSALSVILRDEGFDISKSSIDRHQRKECTCFRKIGR